MGGTGETTDIIYRLKTKPTSSYAGSDSMGEEVDELASVRHLLTLGYADPAETSAREAAERRQYGSEQETVSQTERPSHCHSCISILPDSARFVA
jgi:hypothetical protein